MSSPAVTDVYLVYVIHEFPASHPAHYVVWPYRIENGRITWADEPFLAATLGGARKFIPRGLHRFPVRDGSVIETWV